MESNKELFRKFEDQNVDLIYTEKIANSNYKRT